jgi:2-keto-3-deoxy-L-rhamnonate aldolase RhmA
VGHPAVQRTLADAIAVVRSNRKRVGTLAHSADAARALAATGVDLILVGTGAIFGRALREFVAAARQQP